MLANNHLVKKKETFTKGKTKFGFQLLAITYLFVFNMTQLSSPTTALFSDMVNIEGIFSTSGTYNKTQQPENDISAIKERDKEKNSESLKQHSAESEQEDKIETGSGPKNDSSEPIESESAINHIESEKTDK